MMPLITAWERIAAAFSKREGVEVRLVGTQARTDGKIIYLPANLDYLSAEAQGLAEGLLDHEWLHVREEVRAAERGDRSPLQRMARLSPQVREIFNWIEDVRIERAGSADYEGVAMNLDRGLDYVLERTRSKILEPWDDLKVTLIARGRGREWEPGPVVAKLLEGPLRGVVARVRACATPAAVERLARDVWDRIEELVDPPPPPPPPPEEGDDDESGEDDGDAGIGDGGAGDEGEDGDAGDAGEGPEGDDDAGAGDDEAGGDDGGAGDDEGGELTPDERSALAEGARRATGSSDLVDEVRKLIEREAKDDRRTHRRWIPHPKAVAGDRWVRDAGRVEDYFALRAEIMPVVGPLRAKLLAHLRARARDRVLPEQEEGELDTDALHMLSLPAVACTDVFRRKLPGRPIKCAFATAVDCSGSMHSRGRDRMARACALAFGESLEPLQVPHLITGWTNDGRSYTDERFSRWMSFRFDFVKDFDEPLLRARGRFSALRARAQNVDGEALLHIAKRLAVRREPRKVLFVFSDGEPCGGGDDREMREHLAKDVVPRVLAAGIEIYSIGIQTDAVKRFYPNHAVVNRLDELPMVAFELLKGALQ